MSFVICDVNRIPVVGVPECMTAAEAWGFLGVYDGIVVDTETGAVVASPTPAEPTTATDLSGLSAFEGT